MEETLGRSGGKTGGTVSRLGEGRSISRRSCRLKKGGVEKNEAGREEGEGRSKEDWAVVADEVEADVSSVVCPSERRSSEIARLGSAFSRRRPKSFAASKDLWLFKYLALLRQNLQRPGFLPG